MSSQPDLEAALREYEGTEPEESAPAVPEETPEPKAEDEPEKEVSLEREVEALMGDPGHVTLESGTQVTIVRMKTREFFRLMRIITHGALPALMSMQIDFDIDDDAFVQRLLSLVVMSVPESEQETVDFIQSMCIPVGLHTGPRMTRTQVTENVEKQQALDAELANPELADTLTIIEAVVRQEAEDIQGLGKRLGQMWKLAQKTGQLSAATSNENSGTSTQDD